MTIDNKQSKGGKARADKLSQEERSRIAAEGGKARALAAASLPKVEYPGVLELGEANIPCAVLSDGRRVLTENGITYAILGERSGASKRLKRASQEAGGLLPLFIAPSQLKPFIDNALLEGPLQPIQYQDGKRTVIGYDARILRAVCEVWLRAREAKALQKQQLDKAQRAETLMRALADVGLIALVDEATGYQKFRARDELQKILAAYISPELLPWAKRFPDSFYEELHKVRGWQYKPGSNARNAYIGKLTKALIYDPLPPGVVHELERRNPYDPTKKRRRHLHHQLLTKEVGHPHLEKQIVSVTTLLSVSDTWEEFAKLFTKKFPPGPGDLFGLPPPKEDEGSDAPCA
ncbi:P63C domain-containing protein [Methylocystis rosea]|uniref:P63C domain-containing protein n=1 Tax=Methylocystis rosea TaxID=173366 RepID=UPI00037F9EAF|nr:P63C domain-containing protein [Methylocystis rosea]